jgi:SAM-dependent methyltransferase
MLVPLYETVYDRLEIGSRTRLLGLGCGTGLALLLAAARGAAVTGCDTDTGRLAVARERLALRGGPGHARRARLLAGRAPDRAAPPASPGGGRDASGPSAGDGEYDVITAFDPAAPADGLAPALASAVRSAPPNSAVVLAGWGPPERCATARVLEVATRLAEPRGAAAPVPRLSGRDDLEDLARRAGLRPDGSGRVSCPFGYPDLASAVRGLLSTGLFDAAVAATDGHQVDKEIAEALHPYRRADGSVRMENVFRYLIARPVRIPARRSLAAAAAA